MSKSALMTEGHNELRHHNLHIDLDLDQVRCGWGVFYYTDKAHAGRWWWVWNKVIHHWSSSVRGPPANTTSIIRLWEYNGGKMGAFTPHKTTLESHGQMWEPDRSTVLSLWKDTDSGMYMIKQGEALIIADLKQMCCTSTQCHN